jgi:hypothetical protein
VRSAGRGALGPVARALLLLTGVAGCGGGAPLLHPAHVLAPGEAMVGAGLSGQVALEALHAPVATASKQSSVQDLAIGPGLAPWGAGRMGLASSNEAGLTYSGRDLRLDFRHAFVFGKAALSVGLGASAIMAARPGDNNASGVYGGGADIPVLIGWRSAAGLYSFWFGPRGGFQILGGRIQLGDDASAMPSIYDIHGKHFYAGLTAGARVGFRHVHLAVELNASYHAADGTFSPSIMGMGTAGASNVQQLSLTPAGALEVTF